jgi:hypothetical protein
VLIINLGALIKEEKKFVLKIEKENTHTLMLMSQFSRPIVVTLGPRGNAYEPSWLYK